MHWTSTAYAAGQCSNPNLTFADFVADYDLKADGYYSQSYWAAFAFRKTNFSDWYGTSGYMVYYRYNGEIELFKAGTGSLVSSNTGKNLSAWRHVKIVASGSNIKVYVDGNLEIDYNDGTYTSGYFGFNVFGVAARYDNLVMKDNTETYYVRDINGDVLAEYDMGDNLVAEYVYANGQRIVKRNPAGNVDIYLNDHLGSARAMYGSGWSANYYPFGEVASQTGSDEDTHFDFTGQERDHGTGLMYFPRRYYDPESGRWLSVDPIRNNISPLKQLELELLNESPYAYVSNNPLIYIDPNGKYKLHTKLVARYPRLMSAILKTEAFAKNSPRIQQIFREQVGTPVEEFVGFGIIRKDNTIKGIGRGPEVTISDFDESIAGFTREAIGRADIELSKWLVEKLDSENPDIRSAAFELIKRTILHETAHRLDKKGYKVDKFFDEEVFNETKPPPGNDYWKWWYNEVWPTIRSTDKKDRNSW